MAHSKARVPVVTPEPITTSCRACNGPVTWVECPDEGWWQHDVPPDDRHPADVGWEPEIDQPAEELYKSSARRAALPWHVREREDETGRDAQGRFVPKYGPGGRCDRIGCDEWPNPRGSRFCDTHRLEHGGRLLRQLQAIVNGGNQ